jgi:hypothetical protein
MAFAQVRLYSFLYMKTWNEYLKHTGIVAVSALGLALTLAPVSAQMGTTEQPSQGQSSPGGTGTDTGSYGTGGTTEGTTTTDPGPGTTTGVAEDTTAYSATTAEDEGGFDMGWIGLLGLAGLMGLRRHREGYSTTGSTVRHA